MVQRIEKQYGTALTPGGRWLRPLRQNGIASNRCHFKVYVLRLFEVLPLLLGILRKKVSPVAKTKQAIRSIASSAASTRTPPAQGSRRTVFMRMKPAPREPNDSPSGANRSVLSLSRFAGFMMQRIANSPELPSRRAGGGFGHPVRMVLPRTEVIPKFAYFGCSGNTSHCSAVNTRPWPPRQNGITSNNGRIENQRITAVVGDASLMNKRLHVRQFPLFLLPNILPRSQSRYIINSVFRTEVSLSPPSKFAHHPRKPQPKETQNNKPSKKSYLCRD